MWSGSSAGRVSVYNDLCQPWPHVWCGDISGINPEVTGHAAMAATEILWGATGRRFGNCPVPVRPCRNDCSSHWPQDLIWDSGVVASSSWGWPWPSLVGGVWLNMACGLCTGDCSCSSFSEILLPEQINSISSIVVDGATLPVSGYVVYNGHRLVKTSGEWPRCQDWTVTGGPGAWSIEASFGAEVPALGRLAMGVLTLEIAKYCCGMECGLPQSVTRVVRQGVTMERELENLITGLYLPDRFINTYNPSGIRDRARAHSPDLMFPRRQG